MDTVQGPIPQHLVFNLRRQVAKLSIIEVFQSGIS
jgi:hypothetical protein